MSEPKWGLQEDVSPIRQPDIADAFLSPVTKDWDRCKVCDGRSTLFDVIDFHGNVAEDPNAAHRKHVFPLTGIPVYYYKCRDCGLVYTRALDGMRARDFRRWIYNSDWETHFLGDPRQRSEHAAILLEELFPCKEAVCGLDYGGGVGHLAEEMRRNGYRFDHYDPYYAGASKPAGRFNLISCIEVVEHVSDLNLLRRDFDRLADTNACIFLTTAISDNVSSCHGWCYCIPRAGHITIFSRKSLGRLFSRVGFQYAFLGSVAGYVCHIAWRGDIGQLRP